MGGVCWANTSWEPSRKKFCLAIFHIFSCDGVSNIFLYKVVLPKSKNLWRNFLIVSGLMDVDSCKSSKVQPHPRYLNELRRSNAIGVIIFLLYLFLSPCHCLKQFCFWHSNRRSRKAQYGIRKRLLNRLLHFVFSGDGSTT